MKTLKNELNKYFNRKNKKIIAKFVINKTA